jgi:WhiB family redox-sensing transcriptional regulator
MTSMYRHLVPAASQRTAEPTPAWMDAALCAGVDGDLFFPTRGEDSWQAKQICRRCPVRFECLEYALAHGERYGIWGGLTERERRQIRRIRRQGLDDIRRFTTQNAIKIRGAEGRSASTQAQATAAAALKRTLPVGDAHPLRPTSNVPNEAP